MNVCPYCERTVPGVQKICKDCYEKLYAAQSAPKLTPLKQLTEWLVRPIPDVEPSRIVPVPLVFWFLAAAVGLALYALFAFVGPMITGAVLILAGVVIAYDWMPSSVRNSRISMLSAVITLMSLVFLGMSRINGNLSYLRIGAVGGCLCALYILIERRRVI